MNKKISKILTLMSFTLLISMTGCNNPTPTPTPTEKSVNLKFLATSDMHGMMLPYDYALDSSVDTGSVSQMATLIKKLRTDDTIVMDVGDMVQGNYAEMFKSFGIHPMFQALNIMKYDAFICGNHEFNHGIDFIKKQKEEFNGAFLCGNVINKETFETLGSPYTIVEKNDVRVAIIGMVSPCITQWDGDKLTKWNVESTITATNRAINEIKTYKKADVIVAAEHMGLGQEYGVEGSSVTEIAEKCPGLDLIIGAHEHTAVNQKINNVLVMENKSNAQTLVEVEMEVKGSKGNFTIQKTEGRVHVLKDEKPAVDKTLSNYFEPFDVYCKYDAHTVVGKLSNGPLSPKYIIEKVPSTFMQPTALVSLVNEAQMYKADEYLKNVLKKEDKVKVSATAIGNYWANIDKVDCDIRKCDVSLVYKFVNTLYILEMTGKQLRQFMEYSVSFINKCENDHLSISFSSKIPLYQYDLFSGVNYKVDVSKSENKITDLKWSDSNKDVLDTDVFYIAVNNYRANTQLLKDGVVYDTKKGDTLPKLVASDVYQGMGIRECITEYIQVPLKGLFNAKNAKYLDNWEYIGMPWENEENANRIKAVKKINGGKFDIGTQNTKPITTKDIED